ncbi:MAG: MBL fold metallo-hydrolase [bacterium]|nr:MBL fold metallo-hydrolase [bacterium]
MKISFHGAAREVTGSCHLVQSGELKLLLDCGLIQGGKERHERNREPFDFDASELTHVVLSHAHIDHSGRLPLLCRAGFTGPILTTPATADLCRILLEDSAHIHEEDARWKIKRLRKKGLDTEWVKPLYTRADAQAALERLVPVEFGEEHDLGPGGSLRLTKAGHILGAAIVELELCEDDRSRRVAFSGDLGVDGARLLGGAESIQRPDYLLIESTYGNRSRSAEEDRTQSLLRVIERTVDRGGKVLIPSFAVGRTQAILARINDLVEAGKLAGLDVWVDSPMATEATSVFARHPESYSDAARKIMRCGDEPLEFPGLHFTQSVEESIELNHSTEPGVIVSASGMCTAGRIKHHLLHHLGDARNTVLFVGYQARGSLGRAIQSGTSPVRIFGEWIAAQADVETIQGFSAHADREELLSWFEQLGGVPRKTFIVHGEEEASLAFAESLQEGFGADVEVPQRTQEFDLD